MIVTFESTPSQENLSPQELRKLIARRQNSGDDAKYLIAPTPIELNPDEKSEQSCMAAQNGSSKKTKNHLRANRQALREKQRTNKDVELERQANEKMRLQKLERKKQKLYGKVGSRVFDPAANSTSSSPSNCRYPSLGASHESSPPRASPLSSNSASNEQAFRIAFGRKVPISGQTPRPNTCLESVASCTSEHHQSYGKIPTYITARKAKIERQEAERRMMQENAPPEPGLVLMEESERLQTLKLLAENEREARESLRNIPFSMNHQKAARLREAVEYRLKEIEDTRKIFSKEKVFVAQNDG